MTRRRFKLRSAPVGRVPYTADMMDIWTAEALKYPRPGDRFHEMYSWFAEVIAVDDETVTYRTGSSRFYKITTYTKTRAEWMTWPRYRTTRVKGYWAMLCERGPES